LIAFPCSHCGKGVNVEEGLAGKKGQCPHCGQAIVVPQKAGVAAGAVAEKTLPPRQVPATAEGQQQQAPGVEASCETALPLPSPEGGQATETLSPVAAAKSKELYDFLAPPQGPDQLGRLGPYRVLKVLGAGGMGVVFQAEDPLLERKVALKAMLPSLAASEAARQRFLREAQTAAAIEHDHIVHIYQVGEDRGVPFMAMQLLKGEALDERLKRTDTLPLAEIRRIGREAALGLAAAHACGLVHRDIKPANLWLEEGTGRVKILDFGLARAAQDNAHLTQSGAIIGTPAYMAPEQANGNTVDGRTDLFSLGCVLYRLSTGSLPFKGSDALSTLVAIATENPRAPRELNPALPPRLSDLVMQLLEKDPGKRPASADQVAARLASLETAEPSTAPPKGAIQKKAVTSAPNVGKATRERDMTDTNVGQTPGRRLPWRPPVAIAGPALVVVAVIFIFFLKGTGGSGEAGTEKEIIQPAPPLQGTKPAVIDLLKVIDPVKDRVKGVWERQGLDLIGKAHFAHAVIEVPYRPPEEYDYLVEFTRIKGHETVALALARAGHSFRWCLADLRTNFGFSLVDGKPAFQHRPELGLVTGQRYLAKVEVRKTHMTGYLNGQKISELKTDGSNLSMSPSTKLRNDSLLGLSLWAGTVQFHRLEVVEVTGRGQWIARTALAVVPGEMQTPFNGEDLTGWEKVGAGTWTVANGILRAEGGGQPGWLATEREYDNFELELEYRLGRKGNSGVFLHAWRNGKLNGGDFLEIQLIDDESFNTIGTPRGTAAIFGVLESKPTVQSLPGRWYKLNIRSQGRRLHVAFEGQPVIAANLDDYKDAFMRHPGLAKTKGRIGLQQHGPLVEFRNIRLHSLPAGD
jgi:serine/threonine protein kinase/DNA-directed RNA polymerase subunit RPC12/RpoP